ncbi:hypothetical protein [Companilactobacillus jidongensis]|uniref:hypothetical protein n=1 Tax=Companilactobacillus jidongensis TaxID=2486006 RepID=UPI000F779B51|nr:hypothetical protein [Companilactobacillus jidongensis]
MLQVEFVPYCDDEDKNERKYIFTENLNMTINKLEKENRKVIDIDFFNTKDTSYAAIKYEGRSFKDEENLINKEPSGQQNSNILDHKNNFRNN